MLIALPVVLLGGVGSVQCSPPPTVGAGATGGGSWIATAYGPPWNAINGSGVTATGLQPHRRSASVRDRGRSRRRSAAYLRARPAQPVRHHPRVLCRRHRRRDHRPTRRHLRLERPRRPERLGRPARQRHPRAQPRYRQPPPGDHPRANRNRRHGPGDRNGRLNDGVRSARRKRDPGDGLRAWPRGFSPTEPPLLPAPRRPAVKLAIAAANEIHTSPTPSPSPISDRSRLHGRRTTARAQCRLSSTAQACTANGPTRPGRSKAGDSPGPASG